MIQWMYGAAMLILFSSTLNYDANASREQDATVGHRAVSENVATCDPGLETASPDGGESVSEFQVVLINAYDVNDWPFGLDAYEPAGYSYIVAIDRLGTDKVKFYDPSSGMSVVEYFYVDPINDSPYGVVWNNASDSASSTFLTGNHYSPADTMFLTEDFGLSWSMVTEPGGYKFRGMDYYDSWYWATYGEVGNNRLCRFQIGGDEIYYDLPELGAADTPNDVAVMPFGGETYVIVLSYYLEHFLVYSWDGSSLTYEGTADLPELPGGTVFEVSMGLTYMESTGHLYWSYMIFPPWTDDYWIAELTLEQTPIERNTWGAIKSSF